MIDFMSVIKERRSATKFIQDVEISQQELDDMFSLTKFAPSAFNLQHAHYLAVTDPARKEEIYEAANKQYKVKTASATILVLGDTKAYQQVGRLNEGLLNLGVLNRQEYDITVESTIQFYEKRGEIFQREEAIRNASLSAMQFMLIAKAKGWDTCPMIGFDPEAIRSLFNIPEQYIPVLLITLGKEDISSQRPRGYRKPISEFVTYNSF
ncbi:NAD(P)H nitroreductase [Aneurinibacillus migulanus]|uniref:NAD(P)H nitroreductase n=1 Tax=Aneurinibacillus migulanus TaxID=47500 RepID=A0A0D1XBI6_ANEMI|nr:nitroreductase family protein [Aneurinibacillus migulanus]KIV51751.1 NAD(P)H nitroreductase [Aneurinibacillus migulanus]KIV54549.1 NAD(P)H nitroreductase [Aneurinibacillus migulanus]KON97867.1 NAD(P)H nitroreductase [Aneurinibacillus migulanus]KPD08055.1 NAD(P)H nitroreductase [Aneurinibacillus migulanus]MED0891097.1 nitroreductase family protein [Aneurinibacillus migulanus]